MGIYLILLTVILIITLLSFFTKSAKNKDFFQACINCLTTIGLCLLLISLLCTLVAEIMLTTYLDKQCKSQETSIVETVDLVALKDSNLTEGLFFLGSGSLNNSTYYYYYIETEHGFKQNKLDPDFDNVYVKYCSKNDKPRIEKEKEHIVYDYILNKKPGFFNLDIGNYFKYSNKEVGDSIDKTTEYDETRYVIYVPEGSIKTDFTIDMQ